MHESRTYTHRRCQMQTEMGGPEFRAMSDPLAGMKATFCSHCEDHFPVKEFAWSDSDELSNGREITGVIFVCPPHLCSSLSAIRYAAHGEGAKTYRCASCLSSFRTEPSAKRPQRPRAIVSPAAG